MNLHLSGDCGERPPHAFAVWTRTKDSLGQGAALNDGEAVVGRDRSQPMFSGWGEPDAVVLRAGGLSEADLSPYFGRK